MKSILKKSLLSTLIAGGFITLAGCEDVEQSNYYSNNNDDYEEDYGITSQEAKRIEDKYIKQLSIEQLKEQVNKDNIELANMLTELQTKDPSIDSLYYSVNEYGKKTLHVVKNDDYKTGDPTSAFSNTELPKSEDMNSMLNGQAVVPNVEKTETEAKPASGGNFSDYAFPLVGGMAAGYFLNQIMTNGLNNTVANNPSRITKNITEEDKRKRKNAGFYGYSYAFLNNSKSNISNNIKTGAIKSPTKGLTTRSQGQFSSKGVSSRSSTYGRGGGGAKGGGG